jgi:hypothetical protein
MAVLDEFIKDYATQAKGTFSAPIDTSKFTGRQFVAGEDPLQSQAIGLAQAGVGGIPTIFICSANCTTTSSLNCWWTWCVNRTYNQAYQPFMSPYQQQVIDTTLAEYDRQGAQGAQAIRDAAYSSGNFGGGREGAMLGEYESGRLADRAALQAQLLQSGFTQANQLAQDAFTQGGQLAAAQSGLGAAQMGLSNFQRSGLGADVGALGQLGSLRQGLTTSALLTADQQAAQTGAYEPYGRLSQYGSRFNRFIWWSCFSTLCTTNTG